MKIIIIGGGIAGLCAAIALQQQHFEVKVFERAPEVKALGAGLVLGANAMRVLQKLGLENIIIENGRKLHRLSLLSDEGKTITEVDTIKTTEVYGTDNFTIHRADLHNILIAQLKKDTLCLGKAIKKLVTGKKPVVYFEDGTEETSDAMIAADGINSVVRKQLVPGSIIRYAGYTCWRAVIENMPYSVNPDLFSETWGAAGRFGIVPLSKNKLYWYACKNANKNDERMRRAKCEDLYEIFKKFHAPIPEIILNTKDEELISNDILDLKPISNMAFENIVLIGDAAHAMTPNMGQGAGQAIEDAYILSQCLMHLKSPLEAFKEFEKIRIKRVHKIVNDSWGIGKIAQLQNPVLIKLRNNLFKFVPKKMNERRLDFLYKVDINPFSASN
ncbi:MAG: FAD-dependent monooxygenase [Bacteroidota bacterium]|nr:FAD-dependent monooxygenase [Bacteroidota bacterium]